MQVSLQQIYQMTDLAGSIHAVNTTLKSKMHDLTTQVSSIGQQSERPASLTRRWATRAVTVAAVAAMPVLPLAALSVGPLAILAFGVGRDRTQPQRSNALLHGYDVIKANGILGLPEHGAARLGAWAQHNGRDGLYKVAMGVAITLGALGQFVRVPVALTDTGMWFTEGAAQLISGIGAAGFGMLAERYHAHGTQTA